VSLVDTFLNQFGSAVSQIQILVPPNNPVTGTGWNFTSASASGAGHTASVLSNPSGSSPGTILVNCSGSPIASNNSISVTFIGTVTNEDGSWPMSILSA